MTKRNPIVVLLLTFVTCGLYVIFWYVGSKTEMVKKGADIPTCWLLIVPIVNLFWLWKFCTGAEKVTNGKASAIAAFILLLFGCGLGPAIVQYWFNQAEG